MGLYQGVLESADLGVFINLRDSAGNGITSTTVSSKQALDVNVANSVSVGTADESAFTYGTSTFLPVGGVYNSTITNLTSGQSGAASLTAFRDLRVNLRTSGGVELLGQQLMTASVPVTIASNQSAISVTTNALGSATGGTAGTQSDLSGAVYNSSPITLTTGQQAALQSDVNGYLKTNDANSSAILALMKMATGTITTPTLTASSSTLLALNAARKGFSIFNTTLFPIYLAVAATATAAAFTIRVAGNSFYESVGDRVYTGIITMITPTVTGTPTVPVTEYT